MKKIYFIILLVCNTSATIFCQRVGINTAYPLQTLDVRGNVFVSNNQGIGVANPLARLHVADSSVVFTAPGGGIYPAGDVPISGQGRRLLWYVDKGAFRAGYVNAGAWDKDSIGLYSIAMGENTKASGVSATAIGSYATAAGNFSVALGSNTNSTGLYSFATGLNTTASGFISTAMGETTNAIGPYSTTMGFATTASDASATAMGNFTTASGFASTAMGAFTTASGYYSLASGSGSTASGSGSTAMGTVCRATGSGATAVGLYTVAKAQGATSIGIENDDSDNPNPDSPAPTDRIFQIGNGEFHAPIKSNAVTVLRNGNMGIGVLTPSQRLHVGSGGVRLEGPATSGTGSVALSLGGFGDLQVDANGTVGGRFVVKENGKVGIGNATPGFPLSFASSVGDKISLYGSAGVHYGFGIQSYLMQIHTDGSLADIAFGYGSSSSFTETMRIKGNGNVGIGTSAPAQKLQVAGSICATGTIGSCSDIRYKQNFSPIAHSLSSLLTLNGFYYFWKKDEYPDMQFTDERQLGFSAQDVEKLFPEVVTTDASGYKSVDYGRLTPILVEAIKEQQQQIDLFKNDHRQQEKTISDLQQKTNNQEQRINELETLVKKLLNQ